MKNNNQRRTLQTLWSRKNPRHVGIIPHARYGKWTFPNKKIYHVAFSGTSISAHKKILFTGSLKECYRWIATHNLSWNFINF